jgi:hypothetical protein
VNTLPRLSTGGNPRYPSVHVPSGLPESLCERSLWVVGAVTSFGLRHSYLSRPDPSRMVPLYSGLLRSALGADYATVVNKLVSGGYLERDEKYRPPVGGKPGRCRGYRLGVRWVNAPLVRVEITSPQLRANLLRLKHRDDTAVTDPLYLRLKHWSDSVTARPGTPYGEHALLDRVIDGESYFSVDEQGRIHTPVVTLPREYRKHLRVGSYTRFVGIDVRTCQPLLLSLVLSRYVTTLNTLVGEVTHPSPTPYYGIVANCDDFGLSNFRRSCLDGTLYDRLCGETGYGRDEQKYRFLAVVYGSPRDTGTKTGRAVGKLFPGVLELIADQYDRKDRGRVAKLMQRAESEVMIRTAAERFMRLHPDVPLLTLHDCLLVPSGYGACAGGVIRKAWNDRFGVFPVLETQGY